MRFACEKAAALLGDLANAAASSETTANASALNICRSRCGNSSLGSTRSVRRTLRLSRRKTCASLRSSRCLRASRRSRRLSRASPFTLSRPGRWLRSAIYARHGGFGRLRLRRRPRVRRGRHLRQEYRDPGPRQVVDYSSFLLASKAALNEREAARWYATLLGGKLPGNPNQLAKDHIHPPLILRLSA